MQKVEVQITAKTDKAAKAIDKLTKSLEGIEEAGDKNREGFDLLDKVTGGYARQAQELSGQIRGGIQAVKGFSFSLKGLKTALISTGIGALAVGIGLVIENFDKVKEFLGFVPEGAKEAREKIEKEMEALNKSIASQTIELELLARGYRKGTLQGEKLQKAVDDINDKFKDANIELDENNQLTDESLAFIDSQIKAIKKQARNKAILTKVEALYGEELANSSRVIAENSKLAAEQANQVRLQAELAAETNLTQRERLFKQIKASERRQKDISSTIIGLNKQKASLERDIDRLVGQIETIERPKIKREKKKTGGGTSGKSEEEIAAEEEAARLKAIEYQKLIDRANALAQIEQLENAFFDNQLEKDQLEENRIREKYFTLIEAAKKYNQDVTTLEKARDAELEAIQNEKRERDQEKAFENLQLDKEFDALNFEEQIALLDERSKLILDKELVSDDQREELAQQFADARTEIAQKEFDAKMEAADGYASALQDVSGIIGEETAAGKAIAVAASLISTYSAIAGQLQAFSKVPVPGYAIAQAIATGAVGLANVKSIISTKVPRSSGGSAASVGSAATATPQAPSFNIVGATETSQLAEAIGEQTQQPVQAYVVANDVTTAQSLQNNIVEGATL